MLFQHGRCRIRKQIFFVDKRDRKKYWFSISFWCYFMLISFNDSHWKHLLNQENHFSKCSRCAKNKIFVFLSIRVWEQIIKKINNYFWRSFVQNGMYLNGGIKKGKCSFSLKNCIFSSIMTSFQNKQMSDKIDAQFCFKFCIFNFLLPKNHQQQKVRVKSKAKEDLVRM